MKVGFIGLGIMGKPMCKNIIKAGHEVWFNSRHADVVSELEALGAHACDNACKVAAESEVVITMVPNSPQVREVALGKGGIIESGKKGLVVIDMSSIDPVETRSIGAALAEKGIEMIDAPVSGGEPKAIDGRWKRGADREVQASSEHNGRISCALRRSGSRQRR